ncbi:MAG: nitrogen fixation protein NifX [Sulfuritalea sp.]|nr:nitrogen fixation protein NifX [Sulfuritalea sp.]
MTSLFIDPSTAPTANATRHHGRRLALAWSATSVTPAVLKVAFATDDRAAVNQHFGAAVGFAIYALDGERRQLVELAEFPPEAMDGNETRLPARIAALTGCAAVYCLAVGASAVRQLLAAGIQPIRLDDEAAIEPLLKGISSAIRHGGIAWVDKALHKESGTGRFERMAADGWEE